MIAGNGLSPIAPPWTLLTAYDLNEGIIKWKIPLGKFPELAAKGIKNTGTHYRRCGRLTRQPAWCCGRRSWTRLWRGFRLSMKSAGANILCFVPRRRRA